MNKLRAEEFVINFELMKRSRFYTIFNPNGSKIFNCNVYRLLLRFYGVFVNCIVIYSTLGFLVKMEDTLSYTDYFITIFVMIHFFLSSWRSFVFLFNFKIIYDVFNVSRFNFLKSKHCCKNKNVLCGYRYRMIKFTNQYFVLSSIVMLQWVLFPLMHMAFITPENENIRRQNIMNLRIPVSIHTYNQYYFIFYLIEVVVAIFTVYSMLMPDILLISWCWSIIAQQEVLRQAFKYIGHEDNSQKIYYEDFKSILVDQIRLDMKIKSFYSVLRPVILTYIAIISTCFIIITYVVLVLQSVNISIYSCDWTKMDVQFKKLLFLTMLMNNANNLMIKASPKKIVNLQLFSSIISMSYNIVSVMLKTTD